MTAYSLCTSTLMHITRKTMHLTPLWLLVIKVRPLTPAEDRQWGGHHTAHAVAEVALQADADVAPGPVSEDALRVRAAVVG